MKIKHPMGFNVPLYSWRVVMRAWFVHYRVKLRFFIIYLKNSLFGIQCPFVAYHPFRNNVKKRHKPMRCGLIAGHSGGHRLSVDENHDN